MTARPTREHDPRITVIQQELFDEKKSKVAKYQDLVVGSRSPLRLVLHEMVVLFTEAKELNRQQLSSAARDAGFPEIFLPKQIIAVDAVPLLGSGKVDYMQIAVLYKEMPHG